MPLAGRTPSARQWVVPLSGVLGVGLLGYLVARLGPARIADELTRLGPILPLVLAVTGVKFVLQTTGWRLVLPPDARPPWWESLMATVTGDGLGYLTWAGPITGEPVRAMLLRDRLPVSAGVMAGVAERGMYNATAAAFVWVVLLALMADAHPMWALAGILASVVTTGAVVQRRRRRRQAPAQKDARAAEPVDGRQTAPEGHVGRATRAARQLWRERRGIIPGLALLCMAQHALLIAEAWMLLDALGGAPSVREAMVFEAVTKIVNTAGTFVPARIGVSEGGSALLADALGFAASHGVSLALMRRVRALCWAAAGLALMPLQEARTRRTPRDPPQLS